MVAAVFPKTVQRRVIIACYGGFGRELVGWLRTYEPHTEFLGFIDDIRPAECLGTINDHKPLPDVTYLVANGNGQNRLKIARSLEARGAKLGSLISPRATIGSHFTDESQVIILGAASVSINVTIGRQSLIQELAILGHDVHVGHGRDVTCSLTAEA